MIIILDKGKTYIFTLRYDKDSMANVHVRGFLRKFDGKGDEILASAELTLTNNNMYEYKLNTADAALKSGNLDGRYYVYMEVKDGDTVITGINPVRIVIQDGVATCGPADKNYFCVERTTYCVSPNSLKTVTENPCNNGYCCGMN